ncbi:uncharacterized protein LOC135089760 isoform X2 [Scylla paramamosain]|uniref:uncharacterized protein LOC135089760 isoform X2 n=1 Tax=Scylla paramamosain TaxID=85552 RepID=UPI003083069F
MSFVWGTVLVILNLSASQPPPPLSSPSPSPSLYIADHRGRKNYKWLTTLRPQAILPPPLNHFPAQNNSHGSVPNPTSSHKARLQRWHRLLVWSFTSGSQTDIPCWMAQ